MNRIFEGIYPAVPRPFRNERSVDLDAFAALVDRLYAAGVDGARGRVILHVGRTRTEDGMNLCELGLMAEPAGSEFFILNGYDQVLLPGLSMGAAGGVGSFCNIVPEWFVSPAPASGSSRLTG